MKRKFTKAIIAVTAATLAGCVPVTVSSIAYTTACPEGDRSCEIRQNASTLYYMGQVEASSKLMCGVDALVRESMDESGNLCGLY